MKRKEFRKTGMFYPKNILDSESIVYDYKIESDDYIGIIAYQGINGHKIGYIKVGIHFGKKLPLAYYDLILEDEQRYTTKYGSFNLTCLENKLFDYMKNNGQ